MTPLFYQNPTISLKEYVTDWQNDATQNFDITPLTANDIGCVLSLQNAVWLDFKENIERLFSTNADNDFYQTLINQNHGVVFGVKKDNHLIASAYVEKSNSDDIAFLSKASLHPDIVPLGYPLDDVLYFKQVEWVFDCNVSTVCATATSNVHNPISCQLPPYKKNNKAKETTADETYIDFLKQKGFTEEFGAQKQQNGFIVTTSDLRFCLPKTDEGFYNYACKHIGADITQKWAKKKFPTV